MKIYNTGMTDRLEMRGGGGGLILFGLPFLAAGLFILGMGLGMVPVKNGPPKVFAIPFGSIFGLVGFAMMFGRRGCRMDKKRGTIESWSSLLIPLSRKVREIADFTRVTVTREVRRSDKSTYTVFPVRIMGEDPKAKLDLQESTKYEKSRALAEQVAQFLELPLADSSTGSEVVRAPDELDKSLKERVRQSTDAVALPDSPPDMQTRILRKDRSVRLEIPSGAGSGQVPGKLLLIPVALAELIVLGVAVSIFVKEGGPIGIAALVLVGVFSLIFPFIFIRKVLPMLGGAPTRVTITDRELEVEKQTAFGRRVESIPADELEELFVMPQTQTNAQQQVPAFLAGFVQAPIVARSDKKTIQFAGHLSLPEKEFLIAVILDAL